MESIALLIQNGASELDAAGVNEARREAGSLMGLALAKPRSFIIAHPEYVPDDAEKARYLRLIERRSGREPFHHLKGKKEFYGLDFIVSPDVLIPRPETEMLVEQAIRFLSHLDRPRFCEVGTGSGCIAVSILHHMEKAAAVGLEISTAAITIAEANASNYNLSSRLDIRESDLFAALGRSEKFDLIVSNPPYIPLDEIAGLEPEVRDFEPRDALTDNGDGLSIIRRLIHESPQHLMPDGKLMFEFGFGQADAVRAMFSPELWQNVTIVTDFQGIPRTVTANVKNQTKHW